ncbi:MAG: hypothetical protein ACPGVU_25405, partial [Limisphaerales bacterium]
MKKRILIPILALALTAGVDEAQARGGKGHGRGGDKGGQHAKAKGKKDKGKKGKAQAGPQRGA